MSRQSRLVTVRSGRVFSLATLVALLACGPQEPVGQAGQENEREIPERPIPPPNGPRAVGTFEYHWVDEDRPEIFTRDPEDRRNVMVQVWYPAVAGTGDGPTDYIRHPEEFPDSEDLQRVLHVKGNGIWDADVSTEGGPYPVLIYNHGGGWHRFTSSFTTEALASHGYVVFSVGHAGFNNTRRFPDGTRFEADTLQFPEPTGDMRVDAVGSWDHLGEVHFPVWVDDARFVMDRVEELAAATGGRFEGRLDLENIGMFGWSFGGATALQASRDDPRVKAVVDHDGQLFGDVVEHGTTRPFLLFHSDNPPTEVGDDASAEEREQAGVMADLIAMVDGWNEQLMQRSTAAWYDVAIRGASHGHFSDLVLMAPPSPEQLEPQRTHDIINTVTVAFFNRYLKGLDDDVSAIASGYPEVKFRQSGS